MPHYLFARNEGGVSNFGVHARTVLPYTLAFGLGGLLMLLAARYLPKHDKASRRLRIILNLIGGLLLLVLLTTYPYKLNKSLDTLHILSAQLLFITEIAAGCRFAIFVRKDVTNVILFGFQLLGTLLAALTLLGQLHLLFVSQIITGLAFAALLVRTISKPVNGT